VKSCYTIFAISGAVFLGAAPILGAGLYDGAGAVGGGCTGVAISSTVVLTAAHCSASAAANPSVLSFKGITASSVDVAPGFVSFGDPDLDNDLIAITLSSALPSSVPAYALFMGPPPIGAEIVFVHSDGSLGYNTLDLVPVNDPCAPDPNNTGICTPADPGSPVSFGASTFAFDYDLQGDTAGLYNYSGGGAVAGEDTLRGGDSGGPTFILVNGVPQLLGLNTFVATTPKGNYSQYGSLGGGILVSSYQGFLSNYVSVPEPETWPLLALGSGFGVLGWRKRR
jgi:hypothetical protein